MKEVCLSFHTSRMMLLPLWHSSFPFETPSVHKVHLFTPRSNIPPKRFTAPVVTAAIPANNPVSSNTFVFLPIQIGMTHIRRMPSGQAEQSAVCEKEFVVLQRRV